MNTVTIIPVGHIRDDIVTNLAERLGSLFQCHVGGRMELPPEAFNVERSQFLASYILDFLPSSDDPETHKVLGITDVDLYVPELNYVFGLANADGPAAIVSICRLRQEFYDEECDVELFTSRMVKESIHELGHTFGLEHCADTNCVMYFSNSLIDTDRKGDTLCENCSKQLPLSS